jgi:hypothetical protein
MAKFIMYTLFVYTMLIQGKLQKWGNSYGIRVSKKTASRMGAQKNATVTVEIRESPSKTGFGMFPDLPSFKRDKSDDLREW